MMAILGKILGSDKAIKKGFDLIDKAMDMGDDAIHTGQEKAREKIDLLNAFKPFKLAQRYLAWMFSGVFLFLLLLAAFLYVWWAFTGEQNMRDAASDIMQITKDNLGMIVLSIAMLYFSGGTIESAKRLVRKRNKKD